MEHPHTNKKLPEEESHLVVSLMNLISSSYWQPLLKYLENNPNLIKTFPAFLIQQERIVFYIGRTHLGIEYFGPERINKLPESRNVQVSHYDFSETKNNLFEEIIGFKFESTAMEKTFPLPVFSEDMVYPTNKAMDKLLEL